MKNKVLLQNTILPLIVFSVLALAQGSNKEIKEGFKQVHREQVQKWFSKGDMYDWRNKEAPLKIIICQDTLFPPYLEYYDSLVCLRNDSIYETKKFKDGNEWYPSFKVDKNYMKRISDDYLKGWLEQTNYWLGYLSGGKFQLELEGIERVTTDYWNDYADFNYGTAFTMIVHPNAIHDGYYSGYGKFWINPLSLNYDKKDKNKCTVVPVHEILHGLLEGHSPDTLSSAHPSTNYIGLPKEEADFLGWPVVEPKRLVKEN